MKQGRKLNFFLGALISGNLGTSYRSRTHHSLHLNWETQDLVFRAHITPREASAASVGAHGWCPAAPGRNARHACSEVFPRITDEVVKTSKCGFEGSREIQSICNHQIIGKTFGVLQLRLVGLQKSPFMVNFTHIEVACCICVICNRVRQLLVR